MGTGYRIRLLAVALLVVAACGGGSAPAAGQRIAVTVKEWSITLAQLAAKAGPATFVVKNGGSIEHDFAIEGVGKVETIGAGDAKSLTVTLAPGTYEILCTLAGHKEAGMHGTLVVSP